LKNLIILGILKQIIVKVYADITYDKYCKKGIAFLILKLYIRPKIEVAVRNTTTTICG